MLTVYYQTNQMHRKRLDGVEPDYDCLKVCISEVMDNTKYKMVTVFKPGNILTSTATGKESLAPDTLEKVFFEMQGFNWSPNGEARELIDSLGLNHTSMMVGDVVKDGNCTYWLAAPMGWRKLEA